MKDVFHTGGFITARRGREKRCCRGGSKIARGGRKGKGVNMNKENCEIGHLQWQIWVHLESVGVRALQVIEDG